MLTRRQFIQTTARVTTGATVVLLLTPLGCGDDDSGNVTTTSPTNPAQCDGAYSTSNVVASHTHSICVPLVDLTAPPPAGATYITTLSDGHTHNLILDQGQLQRINRGETIIVTTTFTANHQHVFSLVRITQPTSSPPPAGGY